MAASPHASSAPYPPTAVTSIASRVSSSNLRVLQTVQTLNPETGGVGRAVAALSKGLQQHGMEVEIVALDKPDAPWLHHHSLTVHALGEGLTNYRYARAHGKGMM